MSVKPYRDLAGGVCHRAKNDFQAIANLMAMACPYARTPEELTEAMEGRVGALAVSYSLIHATGAQPTLDRLAAEIVRRCQGRSVLPLRIQRDLPELALSLRLCSPLSLWLYEIIGNAVLHGRPQVGPAILSLGGRLDDDGLLLWVADNGSGLPPDFDLPQRRRFGLYLAQAVADIDLHGRLELVNAAPGLEVRLWVPAATLHAHNRDA
ncbi:MAG: sensor histidine kinase [Desulfarculus sp.]|nr:sensor histidine kinase [Desulfarculus sp.]